VKEVKEMGGLICAALTEPNLIKKKYHTRDGIHLSDKGNYHFIDNINFGLQFFLQPWFAM
jgi:hypothetical protein